MHGPMNIYKKTFFFINYLWSCFYV